MPFTQHIFYDGKTKQFTHAHTNERKENVPFQPNILVTQKGKLFAGKQELYTTPGKLF